MQVVIIIIQSKRLIMAFRSKSRTHNIQYYIIVAVHLLHAYRMRRKRQGSRRRKFWGFCLYKRYPEGPFIRTKDKSLPTIYIYSKYNRGRGIIGRLGYSIIVRGKNTLNGTPVRFKGFKSFE